MASVLVVDDEPDARYLLRYAFQRAGHEVREAAHGIEAIEAVEAVLPDLVVTDMMMPVMGGPELIRRLRADPRTAGIPILCVSGDSDLAVGADIALDKYGDLSQLIPLAETLISEGRAPQ